MGDVPPGWALVLVAVIGLLNTVLTGWLTRRSTRDHAELRDRVNGMLAPPSER